MERLKNNTKSWVSTSKRLEPLGSAPFIESAALSGVCCLVASAKETLAGFGYY
jgi:hypothetical protein